MSNTWALVELNWAAPAAEPRTWWSQGSLLTNLTLAPRGTTLTDGTNCIFSCTTVAKIGSSVLGALPLADGISTTTASAVGLPSLSTTCTETEPAKVSVDTESVAMKNVAFKRRAFFMADLRGVEIPIISP